MRAAAEASHHAHRSPLQGLFDSIDHIFNDRNEEGWLDCDCLQAIPSARQDRAGSCPPLYVDRTFQAPGMVDL